MLFIGLLNTKIWQTLSPPYMIVKTPADAGVFSLLERDKSARVTVRVTVVIKKVLQIIESPPKGIVSNISLTSSKKRGTPNVKLFREVLNPFSHSGPINTQ